jgi:hypothetical protein
VKFTGNAVGPADLSGATALVLASPGQAPAQITLATPSRSSTAG